MQNHWDGYLKAVSATNVPKTSMPFVAETTTSSGFLSIKPKDPVSQAKYDAMSGNWQGIQASESAVTRNVFSTSSSPYNPQQ